MFRDTIDRECRQQSTGFLTSKASKYERWKGRQ